MSSFLVICRVAQAEYFMHNVGNMSHKLVRKSKQYWDPRSLWILTSTTKAQHVEMTLFTNPPSHTHMGGPVRLIVSVCAVCVCVCVCARTHMGMGGAQGAQG